MEAQISVYMGIIPCIDINETQKVVISHPGQHPFPCKISCAFSKKWLVAGNFKDLKQSINITFKIHNCPHLQLFCKCYKGNL